MDKTEILRREMDELQKSSKQTSKFFENVWNDKHPPIYFTIWYVIWYAQRIWISVLNILHRRSGPRT